MTSFKKLKKLLSAGALATVAVSSITVPGFAQNAGSTAVLNIDPGQLTLYSPDDTDNDDLCTDADITGSVTVEGVACTAAEKRITLAAEAGGAISVRSSRQNAVGTFSDILFEDLTGRGTASYSIQVTGLADFVDGSKSIDIGNNPGDIASGAAADADSDAPSGADNGKLFAVLDPSGNTTTCLRPTSAQDTANIAKYTAGDRVTVIDQAALSATPVSIFGTGVNTVVPGRCELDGVDFKLRIPAYVQQGNYTSSITFTIVS